MTDTSSKTEPKVMVFVNGQKYDVDSHVKVGTLIELGGGKPGEYELQQRDGDKGPVIKTYTNPDEVITVKNGEHFTTRFTGPINPA
jgi:hypothetical protein